MTHIFKKDRDASRFFYHVNDSMVHTTYLGSNFEPKNIHSSIRDLWRQKTCVQIWKSVAVNFVFNNEELGRPPPPPRYLSLSVTRLANLLQFGQLFRSCGNTYFAHILGNFCKGVKIFHYWATLIDIWRLFTGHTAKPLNGMKNCIKVGNCIFAKTDLGSDFLFPIIA